MSILHRIGTILAFRTLPTTLFLGLIYITIFTSLLVTEQLPNVPHDTGGLDIDQAWLDLHHISARPHPYNSHNNDHVRSYILSRLHKIASRYSNHPDSRSHIRIWDDVASNASWAITNSLHLANASSRTRVGVYFEGTNVLAKVDGTDPDYLRKGGVLFSAHYDSVSTAPGATDNGMGVVAMLQMVEYLAENRPKSTAVFNFNNGEEDGLHGAHMFIDHPWAKRVDTFLNLEGAAAGGRPLLFRATSSAPLSSFLSKNVPHPHSNVLAADAFALGVIRSGTDYSVYSQLMQGLDFAFYKGRCQYHTKRDSIPGAVGGIKALWSMMEATKGAGLALLNDRKTHEAGGDAVYFDLFSSTLIMFPFGFLFAFNIMLLVLGPMIIFALILAKDLVLYEQHHPESQSSTETPVWQRTWTAFKEEEWTKPIWGRSKFWLALLVALISESLLVFGYVKLNPFVVYGHHYLVAVSTLSLAYLSIIIPLKVPRGHHLPALPEQEKLTVLLQSYVFLWIILLLSTIAAGKWKVGGLYFITAWNFVHLLALALGYCEVLFGAKGTRGDDTASSSRMVRGIRYEIDESIPPEEDGTRHGIEVETEPTEITPLIAQHTPRPPPPDRRNGGEVAGAIGWWIAQVLLAVPIPVILVAHVSVLWLDSLSQTLADGSSPAVVYGASALLSMFIILPLAPYSVKLYRGLTLAIIVIFLLTTAYTWVVFPFSQEAPLKVFFQQRLEIEGDNALNAVTSLTGAPRYLRDRIVSELPSSWSKDVQCKPAKYRRSGLTKCQWESNALLPVAGRAPYGEAPGLRTAPTWFRATTTRLNGTAVRFSVRGTNTRNCRIYLDEPISSFVVAGSGEGRPLQRGYDDVKDGIDELRLWSRRWHREFVVDVVAPEGKTLRGSVACEWAEYESGVAGGISSGGKIPALEEVLAFLPVWALVTKETDGLVEAWSKFSV